MATTAQLATPSTEPDPFITLEEFSAALSSRDEIVLIEFSAPPSLGAGMRSPIDRLASDRQDGFTVRRVDLSKHPQLTWEFDLTACPSYVAFRDGEELFRTAYPTSADLIATQLDESLHGSAPEPLAIAVP